MSRHNTLTGKYHVRWERNGIVGLLCEERLGDWTKMRRNVFTQRLANLPVVTWTTTVAVTETR